VAPAGALLTPSHSTPLVGINLYATFTTVVAPALTHGFELSTVPSYASLVMPALAVVTRAAVTVCGPTGAETVEVAVTGAETPLMATDPGSWPLMLIVNMPLPLPATHESEPPDPPQPVPSGANNAAAIPTRAKRAKLLTFPS
jgi:hypothetical protein